MSGSGDGLDGLRAQFGIPTGGSTAPASTSSTTPTQLSTLAGSNNNSGSSASGDGLDALRAQFGIPTSAPPSSASTPRQGAHQAAATSSGGGGGVAGFFGKLAGGALHTLVALPEGALQLGKDLGVTAFHAGENVVNDVAGSHLGPQSGWADHGGVVASQQEITDTLNQRPALRGAVEGMKQTGNEVAHPSRIPQNYSRDPVGSFLNDAANLSMILGPIAETADAAGASGRAAGVVGKAADVTHAVATAPLKPFTMAAGKLADLGPIAERLDQMRANRQAADFTAENLKQPVRQVAGDVAKAVVPAGKLSADEQAAQIINARNEFGLSAPALAKMSPADRATVFEGLSEKNPNPNATPEAYRIAYDLKTGALPADQAARLETAAAPVSQLRADRNAAYFSGQGMTAGAAGDPAQAGFAPLGKEGLAANDIRNAPARLRPMLYGAQDTIKTLTDSGHADIAAEITPTLDAIRAAGQDAEHVIGGTDKTTGAGSGRTAGMPREKPTGAQLRRLGNQTEYTAHGQAGLEVRRAVEGVRNQFAQKVADPANGFVVAADHVDQGAGLTGSDLYHAAEMQRMVPWDPAKGQPFFPKGQLGNVPPGAVTRSTLFMPKALYDAFAKQEHAIPDPNGLGAKFDRLNTLLRKNPLLLSPTYHLRIATSNAMLAGLQGDLTANPLELARRISETRDMLKTGTAPRALVRNGLFGDEQALMDLRRAGTDQGIMSKFAHGPTDVARKLSAQIDNWSRVMSYIGEKSKGYTDEEAVRRANDVIGNYDQASPFEQNVLRRALPIYPWLKQVAKVAVRLGQDHPVASLFMLNMGQLAAQKDDAEGRPSWMRGWYELGGNRFVPTDLLNPFAVAAAPPGGFVSPLVKGPLAALTGLDTKTWQQYTRPPGQPQSGGLWHNPSELGYVVQGMNPLSRFVRDQQLPDVKRYQTGEPKLKAGALQPAGKPAPLLSVLGVPVPETVDLAKSQAAEAKFQRGQQKAGARYQARLKNAQGK